MALTYPLDILTDWPGWTPDFELMWRQEQSRQANGVTRGKDLGDPLWRMTAKTRSLSRQELDHWRARLDGLENGLKTFKGYPLSRCWPILYPRGSWPTGVSFNGTSATICSIGANNKSIAVDLLPPSYTFSIGDMISITYASGAKTSLHRVKEAATASGGGVTGEFEITPFLPVGLLVNDTIRVTKPYCLMTAVQGSISTSSDTNGRGFASFQAVEYR